jgi:tetratricopeptide (TPR) repeat protein
MSDEWYILSGSQPRGPATIAGLREALARGEIDQDTPVRLGVEGAWTFIRDIPDLSDPSAALNSADLTPVWARRKRNDRLPMGILALVGVICVGALAGIQLRRPSNPKKVARGAANPDASRGPSAIKETPKTAEREPVALAGARAAEGPKGAPGQAAVPLAPLMFPNAGRPAVSPPLPQPPTPHDSFDIPWPTVQRDVIAEHRDWEKLEGIHREYKQLYEQWGQQVNDYRGIATRLNQIAINLQNLSTRAENVGRQMEKIRAIIGDQNAANAEVFAPLETPWFVQSLAKTFTLRSYEIEQLNTDARQVVHNYNATLIELQLNVDGQKKTLTRREQIRSEWVRIAKPFELWTRQDFPVPEEASTRWILESDVFAPAYLARCVAEVHEKKYGKAIEDIGSAIKRDPYWAELYALQAVLQDRAGKRLEAEQSFRAVRQLTKKKRSAFVDVCEGIAAARRNKLDVARDKFVLATKDDPTDPSGNVQLALLLVSHPKPERRDPVAAVAAATAACRATAWNEWFLFDVLSLSYAAGGNFDSAIACIHRAKEAAPNNVQELLDKRISSYKNKQAPPVVIGDL